MPTDMEQRALDAEQKVAQLINGTALLFSHVAILEHWGLCIFWYSPSEQAASRLLSASGESHVCASMPQLR